MIFMASVTLAGFGQKTDLNSAYNAAALEQVGVESWQVPEPLNGLTPSEKALGLLSKIALLPLGINYISASIAALSYGAVGKTMTFLSDKPNMLTANFLPMTAYWSGSSIAMSAAAAIAIGTEYQTRKERRELRHQTITNSSGLDISLGTTKANILDVNFVPRSSLEVGSKPRKALEYLGLGAMIGFLGWALPDLATSAYHAAQTVIANWLDLGEAAASHAHMMHDSSEQMMQKVWPAILFGVGSLAVQYLPGPSKDGANFIATHFPGALNYETKERI